MTLVDRTTVVGLAEDPGLRAMLQGSLADSLASITLGWDSVSVAKVGLALSSDPNDEPGPHQLAWKLGTAGHALLYDDTCLGAMAHLGVPMVSALIASGKTVDLERSLPSLAIGYEVALHLAERVGEPMYSKGFHNTGVLGAVAAAAAVTAQATPPNFDTAIRIAASLGSGLRANFPSMTMALHAGHAAACGLLAAELALCGFTASDDAIQGERGFLSVFSEDGRRQTKGFAGGPLLPDLSMLFKEFPCGAPIVPAIEAALALHEEFAEQPGAYRVRCAVTDWHMRTLTWTRPRNEFEMRVNLRYCVASALLDGRVDSATFIGGEDVCVTRALALADMIEVYVDEHLRSEWPFPIRIELFSESSSRPTTEMSVTHPRGLVRGTMSSQATEVVLHKLAEAQETLIRQRDVRPAPSGPLPAAVGRAIVDVTSSYEMSGDGGQKGGQIGDARGELG